MFANAQTFLRIKYTKLNIQNPHKFETLNLSGDIMNENKTALIIAILIVILLLLFLGGGIMSGAMLSGGMMGTGSMVGFNWMWLPILLLLVLMGIFLWIVFGHKK